MRSLFVGTLALAVAAASAQASTVYTLDTGLPSGAYNTWTVTRSVAQDGGSFAPAEVHPLVNYDLGSPWIRPATVNADATSLDGLAHSAAWVSSNSPTSGDTNGTKYTYTNTFNVSNSYAESYDLKAYVSTDNWFNWATSTITFTGSALGQVSTSSLLNYVTPIGGNTGNEQTYALDIKVNDSGIGTVGYLPPTQITLSFDVINSYGGAFGNQGPSSGFPNPGPTGFILAGSLTATPVPLPAAAWLGFSMLGGMGLLAKLRKRKISSL